MLASLLMEWKICNALLQNAKKRERERESEKQQIEENKINIV